MSFQFRSSNSDQASAMSSLNGGGIENLLCILAFVTACTNPTVDRTRGASGSLTAAGDKWAWAARQMQCAGGSPQDTVDLPSPLVEATALSPDRGTYVATWTLDDGRPFVSLGLSRKRTSCALDEAGHAYCWGRVPQGQPTEEVFRELDGGDGFLCGLTVDGRIRCWSSEEDGGELSPPAGRYRTLATGFLHGCALADDSRVVCWAGQEDADHLNVPDAALSALATGDNFTCGVTLGAELTCWGEQAAPVIPPVAGTPVAVAVGHDDVCILTERGSLRCSEFEEVGPFISVTVGHGHICALRDDGRAQCWSDSPEKNFAPDGIFTEIEAGDEWTCALRTDGAVLCWGDDFYGQVSGTPHDRDF